MDLEDSKKCLQVAAISEKTNLILYGDKSDVIRRGVHSSKTGEKKRFQAAHSLFNDLG